MMAPWATKPSLRVGNTTDVSGWTGSSGTTAGDCWHWAPVTPAGHGEPCCSTPVGGLAATNPSV